MAKKKADASPLMLYFSEHDPVPYNHFKLIVLYPPSDDPILDKQNELNRKNIGAALAKGRIAGYKQIKLIYDERGDVKETKYSNPYVDADVAAEYLETINPRFKSESLDVATPQPEASAPAVVYAHRAR